MKFKRYNVHAGSSIRYSCFSVHFEPADINWYGGEGVSVDSWMGERGTGVSTIYVNTLVLLRWMRRVKKEVMREANVA